MLKLYEYFGLIAMFYANEPSHVHGKCRGREGRAELMMNGGRVAKAWMSIVSPSAIPFVKHVVWMKNCVF